ncbi:MAG: ABC transporter permease, partial [Anaerolineales bacterium]|nr:ABC transporter permease [Anaerolineales bacterium]
GVKGDSDWQVVGLVFDAMTPQSALAPRETLLRETHSVNKANTVMVRLTHHDAGAQTASANGLKSYFEAHQMKVSTGSVFYDANTVQDMINLASQDISIIVGLLGTMAVIMAIVGSIALGGVLSINVLERRREIGVMRAIGASDRSVLRIVLLEGIIIGLLSWVIGGLAAVPTSYVLAIQVGTLLLRAEPTYTFSFGGTALWLVTVIILAIFASFLPARSASRVTVREVLSYE